MHIISLTVLIGLIVVTITGYDPQNPSKFFFLPQKFCGNVAGIPRKNFVSMGVQGCLLFVISAMILVALQKQ